MNFTRIRRLIQYLLLLYVLALTDLWSTLSRIWKKDQPPFVLDDRTIDKFNPFSHFTFAKPVIAAVVKSPSKIRKMVFPQGVPIFADNSDEHSTENVQNEEDELDNLFADAVGPMTSDWAAGPRDETTLPRILLAMRSINKNEADYALNEMVKIVEKLNMDFHSDLMAKSFEAFIKISQDKAQTDQRYANILNHLPFLYSCSSSSDEYVHYGEQMLDYLLQCLKGRDQYRRTAIYATNALLERDSISNAEIKDKVVPALFGLLLSNTVSEEHRNELATAVCRIAQSRLEPEWIFYNFLPKYSLLLRDEHVHVKKAAIAILGFLAREYGDRFTEEFVVPHVVALIDDNNWSVRKIICEIFVEVSRYCPAPVRKNILAPRFIYLIRDTSRWVSYQALQELGPFIATFADSSITGLNINEKGQVVSDGAQRNLQRQEYNYGNLPEGVYVPTEHNTYATFSQEEADNVLGEMTSMLDNWDSSEFRNTVLSDEDFASSPSIAAKCSSVEDLTSLCFNDLDHDKSFFESNEDENMEEFEEHKNSNQNREQLNVEELERNKNDDCQVTYWNASADIVDISDDLVAFGTVCITSSMSKLVLSNERMFTSSSKSDSIKTFKSGKTSDTSSLCSDDGHPLPDCRGYDEEDDKMDTSDAELSDVADSQFHNHVPKELVDNFLSMVTPSATAQDPDINRYCAHNFPAVAYTLGRESWPLLRDTYKRLANEDLRVRMSIASSLHEIGRIIGIERTDSDLLPIFIQYKDDAPEIRYNILKNLYEFFQCLSDEKRDAMMSVLPEIMPVSANITVRNDWRYRHEFVKQCRKLCNLYGDQEINKTMSAIALTMANDRIAEVRTEAVLLIVEIIRRFSIAETQKNSNEITDEKMQLISKLLKDVISSFAKTQKWSRRLTFTHICQGILEQKALSSQQFRHYLLAQLFGMTSDKVANVRLGSCRVLALLDPDLSPLPIGGETTPTVKEMLKKLCNDNDIDVAREARLSLKEIAEDKTDVNLRGRKIKIKEEAFFKDGNISSYEIKDMSVDSQSAAHEVKDNYDVVDMDISTESDLNDEPDSSEC